MLALDCYTAYLQLDEDPIPKNHKEDRRKPRTKPVAGPSPPSPVVIKMEKAKTPKRPIDEAFDGELSDLSEPEEPVPGPSKVPYYSSVDR